ncbi:MAG: porin [Pseudomonadota bacterium]
MANWRGINVNIASLCVGAAIVTLAFFSHSETANAADPIDIDVSGRASIVAGVSDGDGKADADAEITVKGSTVLDSGVEIGAVLEGRLDGQQPRQYFAGGRYSGLRIGGPRGVGPLTSDAYLQGAYAFARGGFGRFSIGREQGVARSLAVTAPTIFQSFNVNDWRTDLSGLNDIHTVNDFSGYATKFSYMPPANLLGGAIGSLRLGVSYSPSLIDCGERLCAPSDRFGLSPDALLLSDVSNWSDVVEAAAYYQKSVKFGGPDRLLLGFGASFVTAEENALVTEPIFSDYQAISLGLNLGYRGVTLGGSVKTTNAGFNQGGEDNYLAFDAGVTFKTGEEKGDWGFMLGYGRSEADLIGPTILDQLLFQDTQSAQAGVTYYLGRGIAIGAAAQFVEATKPLPTGRDGEAASVVIESSIKF